jgi:hypothetical protein
LKAESADTAGWSTGPARWPPLPWLSALLDHGARQQPLKPRYFWSDRHGAKIQFASHSAGYDWLEIEAGDPQDHNFLPIYYQGEIPVAVLGMNQPRLFTKWRRSIGNPAARPAPTGRVSAAASRLEGLDRIPGVGRTRTAATPSPSSPRCS